MQPSTRQLHPRSVAIQQQGSQNPMTRMGTGHLKNVKKMVRLCYTTTTHSFSILTTQQKAKQDTKVVQGPPDVEVGSDKQIK